MNLDDLKFYGKIALVIAVVIAFIVGFAILAGIAITASSQKSVAELRMVCDAAQGQYVLNSNGTASCYYPKPTPIGAGR